MSRIKIHSLCTPSHGYIGFFKIVKEWERLGFIEIGEPATCPTQKKFGQHMFTVWVGRVGGMALEPTLTRLTYTPKDPFEHALVTEYTNDVREIANTHPWNFWVRHLDDYDAVRNQLSTIDKEIESFFSGTIRKRHPIRNAWMDSTEVFSWRVARRYTRMNRLAKTMKDYYMLLASSKFGLCPMGDQGYCQREVECLGLGVIPIFTPGVEYNYHEPLVKDVHFIYAENPEEMNRKISEMDEEKIKWMINNGLEYYERRISPKGMWNSVLETVDKYNIKVD